MDNKSNAQWSIQNTWNELLTKEYPLKPRGYIRGSEIGKPFLDRFLAMKGVQPTNPFPSRIKRVFDVGLIFEIEVVERLFKLLGILQEAQKEVTLELDGMLPVIGHFDHKVGGKINVDAAKLAISDPTTPQWIRQRATQLLNQLSTEFPDGLKTLIAEIKTVNSMAFWAHKNIDPKTGFFKGYHHHRLQLLTYLMSEQQEEGRLFYISKDDLTLFETPVYLNDEALKKEWMDDVATMTKYIKEDKEPEPEPNIVFNEEKGIWQPNWSIARSNYFTLITGFISVEDWEASLYQEIKQRNSAECKLCKKTFSLTTLNKNDGYCAKCAKKKGGE